MSESDKDDSQLTGEATGGVIGGEVGEPTPSDFETVLEEETEGDYELNLNYEKTFGEDEHKLTADLQARNSIEIEEGNLVETAVVGSESYYVVDDDGFMRHVDSEAVDRQVLSVFLAQLEENKELAVEQMLNMMGKDDLFTKAAIDASLRNIDMDQIIAQGLPEQARNMMGMLGFRIIINHHGEVIKLDQPTLPDDEV